MPLNKGSLGVLNRRVPLELILHLDSFSGGENTKGSDGELKNNEARRIENWDALSIGGMQRSKGFNRVATGGVSYTDAPDLLIQHLETPSSTRVYAVIEGDVVYKNGADLTLSDNGAFTSGVLCHAVSAGNKLWITNSTDNLKYTTIAGSITIPSDLPDNARERIYESKSRLIAEGGGREVYGSRAGSGNWTAADAWTLANDAWNITMPDKTYGMVPGYPSGDYDLIFTYYAAYVLGNYPDVAYRQIGNSRGCCAAWSIARGDEGVFFLSNHPTLGVYLFNGVDFINLTINHDFVDDIDLAKRIYGVYRNNQYFLIYCENGSGVTYPNRVKIYNTKFGRWMTRPINATVSDNFGFPALLKYENNALYFASSKEDSVYEMETDDNSDEDENTESVYETKYFSSRDFLTVDGKSMPVDDVRLKLIKMTIGYYGITGSIGVAWDADYGKYTGSQTITMSATGAKLNIDFTMNSSYVLSSSSLTDMIKALSFNNTAVGRRFKFTITNNATGERPKVKFIRIHAVAMEDY